MDSLRTYAAPYEDDADGGEAGDPAAALLRLDAAERHAALTEQAQRLLHQDPPSATDIRMYNMMLTRESTVEVGHPALSFPLAVFVYVYVTGYHPFGYGGWIVRVERLLQSSKVPQVDLSTLPS